MIIFITGKPGSGKTTLIKELIEELKRKGKIVGGIISPEIRNKEGEREGFYLVDLFSGEKALMADAKKIKSGLRVSKYKVSVENINRIIEIFWRSADKYNFIVIDEIGRMELFSDQFMVMLNKIFDSGKPALASLHLSCLETFKEKGKVYFLTKDNYSKIKEEIKESLKI